MPPYLKIVLAYGMAVLSAVIYRSLPIQLDRIIRRYPKPSGELEKALSQCLPSGSSEDSTAGIIFAGIFALLGLYIQGFSAPTKFIYALQNFQPGPPIRISGASKKNKIQRTVAGDLSPVPLESVQLQIVRLKDDEGTYRQILVPSYLTPAQISNELSRETFFLFSGNSFAIAKADAASVAQLAVPISKLRWEGFRNALRFGCPILFSLILLALVPMYALKYFSRQYRRRRALWRIIEGRQAAVLVFARLKSGKKIGSGGVELGNSFFVLPYIFPEGWFGKLPALGYMVDIGSPQRPRFVEKSSALHRSYRRDYVFIPVWVVDKYIHNHVKSV